MKIAPTIDNMPTEQREQFAIWFEHILRRLVKTKDKEQEVKHIIQEIHKKGLSAVKFNLEKNLEWLEERAVLRGMEKGMEKGIQEGVLKGMEQVALNMLQEGLSESLIIKMTGLSQEKLEKLKKQLDDNGDVRN